MNPVTRLKERHWSYSESGPTAVRVKEEVLDVCTSTKTPGGPVVGSVFENRARSKRDTASQTLVIGDVLGNRRTGDQLRAKFWGSTSYIGSTGSSYTEPNKGIQITFEAPVDGASIKDVLSRAKPDVVQGPDQEKAKKCTFGNCTG
ncbi:hypothetical protein AAG570_013592 [Ranatra chinensis]|uniref:Uncharacterized protein n=1 Tax=Ranatra chinensis TaxID=642074 RepID=A0ABD0YCM7_9HEMI